MRQPIPYPGEPVWIFEQLLKINDYVKERGFIPDLEDEKLKQIERPFFDYRHLLADFKLQPMWLPKANNAISQPHILCRGWFYELKVFKLQDDSVSIVDQEREGHEHIHTILITAIEAIKQTREYQAAEVAGHLL